MPKGPSGRIVVDVDPEFKRELYTALASRGSTLKDWFIRIGQELCDESRQPILLRVAETAPRYAARHESHLNHEQ
jgi:hypothetical protein